MKYFKLKEGESFILHGLKVYTEAMACLTEINYSEYKNMVSYTVKIYECLDGCPALEIFKGEIPKRVVVRNFQKGDGIYESWFENATNINEKVEEYILTQDDFLSKFEELII